MPDPDQLPTSMKAVTDYNGVKWIHDYQDACVDKIDRFIRGDAAMIMTPLMDRFLSGASSTSGSVSYNRQNSQYQRTISNDISNDNSECNLSEENDWQLTTVSEIEEIPPIKINAPEKPPRLKHLKSEAQNLVQSCEDYLDQNTVGKSQSETLINPFFELKMYNPESEEEQKRKLSSVSDIRDSIKETFHEEYPSNYKTVPRIRSKSRRPYNYKLQDGTESVSSFVALTPGHSHSTLSSNSSEWSNSDEQKDETQKGFVNKYFSRVKNFSLNKKWFFNFRNSELTKKSLQNCNLFVM